MNVLKLRNHIPIASPARREPTDGTETDMRVSLGFEPAWFNKRCGVDFSERWHKDPYYRYISLKEMKEALTRFFPAVPYWDTSSTEDLATISGCYGAYFIPHGFGIDLLYSHDKWPMLSNTKLSTEEIEGLDVDKILASPVIEELFLQMDFIEEKWGKIHGYLNWQGILNNAFNIRGQKIFVDMFIRPEFVHRFFSVIYEVMVRLAHQVQERQRRSGFPINQISLSNCVMNMLSPHQYSEFVFPYDRKIAYEFERFGVHTCNWNITPYIEVLSKLPKLGYVDMGIMSDLPRVKKAFPEARRAVMYSPNTLQNASLNKITADMEKIYSELSPCDIVMADIQYTTSDSRVNDFLKVCMNLERKDQ